MSYPRFSYKDFVGMNSPKEVVAFLEKKKAKLLGYGASGGYLEW